MATAEHTVSKVEFGQWEGLKFGGTPPSTRYSQAATLLGETIYLFGGASSSEEATTTYHGDLFSLNLEKIPLEWQCIQQTGNVPSAREGATISPLDDKLCLFGGVDEEGSLICAEGVFLLTPAGATWERLSTSGPAPKAQSSSTVVYENKLIIFGGILNGKAQNTLHSFDFSSLEWEEITSSGTVPPPRCDHVAAVAMGKMFVLTGSGSEELWFNDIHALDLASYNWSQLQPNGDVVPVPRDYATINCITDTYLVQFGGFSGTRGGEECFADLHCVDLSQSAIEWQSANVSGDSLPPARYAHSAILYRDKLYILAGQNTEDEFNDVWSISITVPSVKFEPTPVPRVRYSTSTPIPAPRKVITPAPPKTPKPRDFEELRSTYIKKINEMFDTLSERFHQLDVATATMESERAAFEAEKKAHYELYERQQQELKEMINNHQEQNDSWVSRIRQELDNDRRSLAEERAAAEKASSELAKEQEIFQQKSKKLDAIMRQVQGLKD